MAETGPVGAAAAVVDPASVAYFPEAHHHYPRDRMGYIASRALSDSQVASRQTEGVWYLEAKHKTTKTTTRV